MSTVAINYAKGFTKKDNVSVPTYTCKFPFWNNEWIVQKAGNEFSFMKY